MKITDKKVHEIIESINNEDEQCLADSLKTILSLLLEIRSLLTKKSIKTVTDPLKAKKGDIVIGKG